MMTHDMSKCFSPDDLAFWDELICRMDQHNAQEINSPVLEPYPSTGPSENGDDLAPMPESRKYTALQAAKQLQKAVRHQEKALAYMLACLCDLVVSYDHLQKMPPGDAQQHANRRLENAKQSAARCADAVMRAGQVDPAAFTAHIIDHHSKRFEMDFNACHRPVYGYPIHLRPLMRS